MKNNKKIMKLLKENFGDCFIILGWRSLKKMTWSLEVLKKRLIWVSKNQKVLDSKTKQNTINQRTNQESMFATYDRQGIKVYLKNLQIHKEKDYLI